MNNSNELKIDLTETIAKAHQRAVASIDSDISNAVWRLTNSFMSGRNSLTKTEGLGHEILRKKIEEYILSDNFADKLDTIIEEVSDEEIRSAVRTLLNSKSRKVLFGGDNPKKD